MHDTRNADSLLIHVGYHKTGSTWLQQGLFAQAQAGFFAPWSRDEIRTRLVLMDPYRFDPGAARAFFEPGLLEARNRGLVPVLSDELLSGNPREGLSRGRLSAQRLEETFPGARVLVCFREQCSMLVSWYKHHVRAGSPLSPRRFVGEKRQGFEGSFPLAYFEYDALIAHYQQRFGRDRVLALPFEWLREDPEAFARRILGFCGLDSQPEVRTAVTNPGYGGLTATLGRVANRLGGRDFHSGHDAPGDALVRRALLRLDGGFPAALQRRFDARIRRAIQAGIGQRYAASNRRTEELTGLELRRYGYPCADADGSSATS